MLSRFVCFKKIKPVLPNRASDATFWWIVEHKIVTHPKMSFGSSFCLFSQIPDVPKYVLLNLFAKCAEFVSDKMQNIAHYIRVFV